ncbi:GNAT family N-acetyltransferase [Geodermatophilus sp. SYSU D00691]
MTERRPTVERIETPPPPPPPPVRPAEQRDVPRIAATLTLSLGDSRWVRWALPGDGRMQRLTRLHELSAGHRAVSTGTAWVTDDVTAVAAWVPPPGAPGTRPLPDDVRAALDRELPFLSAERWPAVRRTDELVARLAPAGPHWRLAHLGTRPTARRRGAATALLEAGLAAVDASGLPAATAVHAWADAAFLRRSGFTVAEATRTADDELPLWVLVREPGSAAGGDALPG